MSRLQDDATRRGELSELCHSKPDSPPDDAFGKRAINRLLCSGMIRPYRRLINGLLLVVPFVVSCLPTATSSGGTLEFITVDGRVRTYRLYVPDNVTSPALLLVFHGLGGTGDQMHWMTGFDDVADDDGLVVAYPDAEVSTRGQWALDCPRCTGADTLGINDLAFVDSLIERLHRDYGVDRQRVYATGFSLGGYMTHVLACKRPRTFAAVAPVAGHMTNLMADACTAPTAPIPLLEISGMADPVMPWNGVVNPTHTIFSADSSASFWATRNACSAPPTDNLVGSGSGHIRTYKSCNAEVQRWGIPGLGHTWPEGATFGSPGIARFLLRFRRDQVNALTRDSIDSRTFVR